ncbi:MAG: SAM-dependent methyltransferase [Candidatus Nanoarchaeia archaeon]
MKKQVTLCYELLDLSLSGDVYDFTDGIYSNTNDYEQAQKNKANYILTESKCKQGDILLDIGCGYGRILQAAEKKGINAIGITISPSQVKRCKKKGLTVYLMDYKDIPASWKNKFDAVVINGTLEHFVEPHEKNEQNAIYRTMFKTCFNILKKESRLITTAIQFRNISYDKNGQNHLNNIFRNFGGYYPQEHQLEKCAKNKFRKIKEIEGTNDYRITSEYWLNQMKRKLLSSPKVWFGLLGKIIRHPVAAIKLLHCLLISQSWNWQFRGTPAPTKLLRITWKKI